MNEENEDSEREEEGASEVNDSNTSGRNVLSYPSPEKGIMTASDENKTYVASFSLDERLKKTEKWLKIVSVFMILIMVVILLAVYVKRDTVIGVLASMMRWVFGR